MDRSVRKTAQFDIYAGAGLNDITKGTKVGKLTVNYNNSSRVVVTYTTSGGFVFSETHLYVGYVQLKNSAPGSYGNQHSGEDVTSIEYTINVNGSPVYIVAHGVSCGNYRN